MTKLLIVDDNGEMRALMRRITSKVSDKIFECEDGDEVLAAFMLHQPDWVVMDVEMKRMDGLQATASLTKQFPEANVIIVTKHIDTQTQQAASEAGAKYFLGKDDLISLRTLIQYQEILPKGLNQINK